MFIVYLKFTDRKDKAAEVMDGHKAWIKAGFDDGVFLLAGSLQPGLGGAVLADGLDRAALEARVGEDPFVVEGVVTAEIAEVTPALTDDRLAFLKG